MDHAANARTANAVARVENLEFLTDVVPKTQTYKQVKQKLAKEPAAKANGVANGINGKSVQQQIAEFDNMKKSLMRDLQNRCERVSIISATMLSILFV